MLSISFALQSTHLLTGVPAALNTVYNCSKFEGAQRSIARDFYTSQKISYYYLPIIKGVKKAWHRFAVSTTDLHDRYCLGWVVFGLK